MTHLRNPPTSLLFFFTFYSRHQDLLLFNKTYEVFYYQTVDSRTLAQFGIGLSITIENYIVSPYIV